MVVYMSIRHGLPNQFGPLAFGRLMLAPNIWQAVWQKFVNAGGQDQQIALLCAHPELAGKLAVTRRLTAESTAEQASAGLDHCTAAEFDEFHVLNKRYHSKFGHPFIIAVRGLDRHAILDAFRKRIDNNAQDEFVTAMAEVHKIARLRLEQLARHTS